MPVIKHLVLVLLFLTPSSNSEAFFSRCQWYGPVASGCQSTPTTPTAFPTQGSDQITPPTQVIPPDTPGTPNETLPPVSTVPEPATWSLLGMGLIGFLLLRNRRKLGL